MAIKKTNAKKKVAKKKVAKKSTKIAKKATRKVSNKTTNANGNSLGNVKFDGSLIDVINSIAKIMKGTDLSEIEIEHKETRIKVSSEKMHQQQQQFIMPQNMMPQANMGSNNIAASVDNDTQENTKIEAEEPKASGEKITSPMVGTAYLAPAPGANNFISIGDEIDKNQTIMIIEAMKTMNHIPSPRSGKVVDILVKDSQPVQFGDVLIILE